LEVVWCQGFGNPWLAQAISTYQSTETPEKLSRQDPLKRLGMTSDEFIVHWDAKSWCYNPSKVEFTKHIVHLIIQYRNTYEPMQRSIIGGSHFLLLRGDFCGLIGSPSCLFRIGSWKSRFSSRQAWFGPPGWNR
jgi:hypothetical protein